MQPAGDSSSNLGPWVLVLEDELCDIVITRSQLLPNTNWRLNLSTSIVDNVLSHQDSLDEFNCAVCGQSPYQCQPAGSPAGQANHF